MGSYFFYSFVVFILSSYVIFKNVKDDESAEEGGVTGSGLSITLVWAIFIFGRVILIVSLLNKYNQAKGIANRVGEAIINIFLKLILYLLYFLNCSVI